MAKAASAILPSTPLARTGLVVLACSLTACTNQTKLREAELEQLLAWLPGQYDNTAQAQADTRGGIQPPHEALSLAIVPVDDPVIGTNVFYVQEMAADDPRRVMVQKVWTIDATDAGIVQTVWTLAEPLRWRDGQRDPDLLRGMMNHDVAQARGCELTWKKKGEKFVAANDPATCRITSRTTSGTLRIETRMELDAGNFGLAENATDAAGQLTQGRTDEPFYRFQKRGQ